MKKFLLTLATVLICLSLAVAIVSCEGPVGPAGQDGQDGQPGTPGVNPRIGDNGNWWIGNTDTGIRAQGPEGAAGVTPRIGPNGNWWIGDTDTGIRAEVQGMPIPSVFFWPAHDTTFEITAADLDTILRHAMSYARRDIADFENIAVKIHTGEFVGPLSAPTRRAYALEPSLIATMMDTLNEPAGTTVTLVETLVAYGGNRATLATAIQSAELFFNLGTGAGQNNWNLAFLDIPTVAAGEDGNDDRHYEIPAAPGSKRLNRMMVARSVLDYDFYINLSHFTGHGQAGFGSALKNMSLGLTSGGVGFGASTMDVGKSFLHSGGTNARGGMMGQGLRFQEAIAEGARAIQLHLQDNNIPMLHIVVLNNLDPTCDCIPNSQNTPDIMDIGILASWDPVAVDQAAIDLIRQRNRTHLRSAVAAAIEDPGIPTDPRWLATEGGRGIPAVNPANMAATLAHGTRLDGQGVSLLNIIDARAAERKLTHGQNIGLGNTRYILVNVRNQPGGWNN